MPKATPFSWKSQIGFLSLAFVLLVLGGGVLYEYRSERAEENQTYSSGVARISDTHDWEDENVSVDWYWVRTEARHFSRDAGYQWLWQARGTIHNSDESRLLIVGGATLALLTAEGFEIASAVADIQSNIPVGGATAIKPGSSWEVYVEGYAPAELIELVTQLDSRVVWEFMARPGGQGEGEREG